MEQDPAKRPSRPLPLPRRKFSFRTLLDLADELEALSDEHYAAYKHGDPRDARRASSYTEGFCVGLDHAAERLRSIVGED